MRGRGLPGYGKLPQAVHFTGRKIFCGAGGPGEIIKKNFMGEDESSEAEKFAANIEYQRKVLDHELAATGLDSDIFNDWAVFGFPGILEDLEPLLPYAQNRMKRYEALGDLGQYVVEKSNPDKVKEYDALVEEFNRALPKIKDEEDYGTLKSFNARAAKLIRAQ